MEPDQLGLTQAVVAEQPNLLIWRVARRQRWGRIANAGEVDGLVAMSLPAPVAQARFPGPQARAELIR
jgi:hypothetical protein